MGKRWKQWQILFYWTPKSLWMVTTATKLRHLLIERKAMKPRQHIKKQRHHLLTEIHIVKIMVFSSSHVWMWELEKKAEHQGIDAFEQWCWRRLLRVPWTARRSNQLNLKEINPEYSLKGLILSWSSNTLATWCEASTHWKIPYCWKRLRAGGEGGVRGWDGWMVSPTQWAWVWANSGRQWRTRKPDMLQSMVLQRVRHNLVTEQKLTAWW